MHSCTCRMGAKHSSLSSLHLEHGHMPRSNPTGGGASVWTSLSTYGWAFHMHICSLWPRKAGLRWLWKKSLGKNKRLCCVRRTLYKLAWNFAPVSTGDYAPSSGFTRFLVRPSVSRFLCKKCDFQTLFWYVQSADGHLSMKLPTFINDNLA